MTIIMSLFTFPSSFVEKDQKKPFLYVNVAYKMITRVYARSLWFSSRNNIFDIHGFFRFDISSIGMSSNLGYNLLS